MPAAALFSPGETVTMVVDVTSARLHMPRRGGTIRVLNPSSRPVWLEFGGYTVTANTSTSVQMLPNSVVQWRLPREASCMAAIATAATGNDKGTPVYLNVTFGEGS